MTTPELRSFTLRYPDGYEETVYYRSDATPDSLELAADLLRNSARVQLPDRDGIQSAGGPPDGGKPTTEDAGESDNRPAGETETVIVDQDLLDMATVPDQVPADQADVDQVDQAVLDRRIKDRDRKRRERARKRASTPAAG